MICEFNEKYSMFDVTPVENLFIEEYMLRAPGDYVKVYLYGLRLCYHGESMDLPSMAHNLGMEQADVLDAFRYWERQNILRRVADQPPKWQFFNLKQTMLQATSLDDGLYPYRDFNNSLQSIFGTRLLHPQDFEKVFDWVEVFKLPQEIVFMMVKHYVNVRGPKVAMSFLDKVAKRWAQENINTVELAESVLERETAEYDAAQRIIKQMGMRRSPTLDEVALVHKWFGWGYAAEPLVFACAELTKAKSPSFAYLDKVLESHHKDNRHTVAEMENFLRVKEERSSPVRRILYALGTHDMSPTPELGDIVNGYKSLGFTEEALEILTNYSVKQGGKTFNDVDRTVRRYHDMGIHTKDEVIAHLQYAQNLARDAEAVLLRAGEERLPTAAERGQIAVWLNDWDMPGDVILQAAEYARFATAKVPFMTRILQKWHELGIRTVQEAVAEHDAHRSAPELAQGGPAAPVKSTRPSKEVSAHRYHQRQYTDEELNELLASVAELDDE